VDGGFEDGLGALGGTLAGFGEGLAELAEALAAGLGTVGVGIPFGEFNAEFAVPAATALLDPPLLVA